MDAILFCANPNYVDMEDVIDHLKNNEELYWEIRFNINKNNFSFPMVGLIHISGDKVRYKVIIKDIIPFSSTHFENTELAQRVKPKKWRESWNSGTDEFYSPGNRHKLKRELVITEINDFDYPTKDIKDLRGSVISRAPMNYIRILDPSED